MTSSGEIDSADFYKIPCFATEPITPTEAAEEMDDREAEELAEEVERIAGELGDLTRERDGRSWSELDASTEADRRFKIDFIDRSLGMIFAYVKWSRDPDSKDQRWKVGDTDCLPDSLRGDVERTLRAMAKKSVRFAREVE